MGIKSWETDSIMFCYFNRCSWVLLVNLLEVVMLPHLMAYFVHNHYLQYFKVKIKQWVSNWLLSVIYCFVQLWMCLSSFCTVMSIMSSKIQWLIYINGNLKTHDMVQLSCLYACRLLKVGVLFKFCPCLVETAKNYWQLIKIKCCCLFNLLWSYVLLVNGKGSKSHLKTFVTKTKLETFRW